MADLGQASGKKLQGLLSQLRRDTRKIEAEIREQDYEIKKLERAIERLQMRIGLLAHKEAEILEEIAYRRVNR